MPTFRNCVLVLSAVILLAACATPSTPQPVPAVPDPPTESRTTQPKLDCLSRVPGTDSFTVRDMGPEGAIFTYTGKIDPGNTTSTDIVKGEHFLGYDLGSNVAVYLAQSEIISQTEMPSPCSTTRWQKIILAHNGEIRTTGITH